MLRCKNVCLTLATSNSGNKRGVLFSMKLRWLGLIYFERWSDLRAESTRGESVLSCATEARPTARPVTHLSVEISRVGWGRQFVVSHGPVRIETRTFHNIVGRICSGESGAWTGVFFVNPLANHCQVGFCSRHLKRIKGRMGSQARRPDHTPPDPTEAV